jgi:feruloyl-CoA synthase
MILSGNSVEHLLLTLAAFRVGSPAVPVSVAYSLQSSDHDKLRRMAGLVCPGLVFAEDAGAFGPALAAVRQACPVLEPPGEPVMVTLAGGGGTVAWPDLAAAGPGPGDGLPRSVAGPDTVAKLLFTPGSTGEPKAVVTTQRMLCANRQAMLQVWPFLAGQPPVLLDWLPWSHTFGGSHNVGMVLYNGGRLYIDDSRPAPGLIEATLRNLGDAAPTVFFNVPVGVERRAGHRRDPRPADQRGGCGGAVAQAERGGVGHDVVGARWGDRPRPGLVQNAGHQVARSRRPCSHRGHGGQLAGR